VAKNQSHFAFLLYAPALMAAQAGSNSAQHEDTPSLSSGRVIYREVRFLGDQGVLSVETVLKSLFSERIGHKWDESWITF
jgi:hypothetical protein